MNLNDDKARANRVVQQRGGTGGVKRAWVLGLEGFIGTLARMVYGVTYAVVLFASTGTRRDRTRARRLAARVEAGFERHAPAGLAIIFNLMLLWLMATWSLRQDRAEKDVEDSTGLVSSPEGFLTDLGDGNPAGTPPGGGGLTQQSVTPKAPAIPQHLQPTAPSSLDSILDITLHPHPPTLTPPDVYSALTTQSKSLSNLSKLSQNIATSQNPGKGSNQTTAHNNDNGSGQGSGQGSGVGQGSGGGQGGGTFARFTTAGNGQGKGKGRPGSITGLRGMDLVVLVDYTSMTGDGGGYIDKMAIGSIGHIMGASPLKVNFMLLPNILAQQNTILEARTAGDDNLWNQSPDSYGPSAEFTSLHHALLTIGPRYTGRPNTAIVIGSEFQYKTSEPSPEELHQLEDFILSLKLPIFFISLGDEPDQWFVRVARKTGGSYLGMIPASRAIALSKNKDTLWPLMVVPIGPTVPKGDLQPNVIYFQPPKPTVSVRPRPS